MIIDCNIWMICLKLNYRLFYDPSWMLQLSEFVWTLRSLVWVVFNNFLLIDATDRSKISSDQKLLFFAIILYFLYFSTNTPFKWILIPILSNFYLQNGHDRFSRTLDIINIVEDNAVFLVLKSAYFWYFLHCTSSK